jgi:hypothetical protein
MSNFKNTIRDRYKGRGNCWVKVPNDSNVYNKVMTIANSPDGIEYVRHVEREGFAWIRFSKPTGSEDNPQVIFEVRKRGSKIDHPDCVLIINDNQVKDLPLLGNTPVKMQLEINPEDRKKKQEKPLPKRRKTKNSTINNGEAEEIVRQTNEIIKEAKLSSCTELELKEWEKFLKLEGLLEYTY